MHVGNARLRTCPSWLRSTRRGVPPELVRSAAGLRWAAPELTALDLAAATHGESVFALLRSGSGTLAGLAAVLAATPRRPGNADRSRALQRAANNPWSGGEQQFQSFLRHEQLSEFVGNLPVRVLGHRYVLDLGIGRLRVGIEFDSVSFHADRRAFEADRRKHNDLEAAGWRILHVTWQMLTAEPELVLDRIRRLIRVAERG